jgi:hypothetical protein
MIQFVIYAFSYVMVSFVITSIRAWRIGVHRAEAHSGKRQYGCEHFACNLMAVDFLVLMFLFWPVCLPVVILAAWYMALMKAPYLRRLPPENEGPGKVIR